MNWIIAPKTLASPAGMPEAGRASGFTLVEIIVAMMIFAIVAVVALAAMVRILDANKKAQAIQDAVTNLSFALDDMTREVRTGSSLYCQTGWQPLSLVSLSQQNLSACASGLSQSNAPNGAYIAMLSARTPPPGQSCRLIDAFSFVPAHTYVSSSQPDSGSSWTVQKAEQQQCYQPYGFGNFKLSPMDDPNKVFISGYYLGAQNTAPVQYPLLITILAGSAGNKSATQTYFTVQTAASVRIP